MREMTLEGLLRIGNSGFARNEANYMIVEVSIDGGLPETIINPYANFKKKLEYYATTYNDDLTLKNNENIKIVYYDFIESLSEYSREFF